MKKISYGFISVWLAMLAGLVVLAGCEDITSGVKALSPDVYTVKIDPLPGGKITATPETPAADETVTLTVTPDDGYRLKEGSLKVNDGAVTINGTANPYIFTMPASDVTVTAEFEELPPGTYSVSIGSFQNGVVIGPDSAAKDAQVTLTVNPAEGYRLAEGGLTVKHTSDGTMVTATPNGNTYTFTMPEANVTVTAVLEELPEGVYSVTQGTLTNGRITIEPTSAAAGATVTLTLVPDAGCRLVANSLAVTQSGGGAVTISGSGPYTFTMPAANVTVAAQFEEVLYTIAITAGDNGTVGAKVSGTTVTRAKPGDAVILAVNPVAGYRLKSGSLAVTQTNGGTAVATTTSGSNYTFTMPAADITVTAQFELLPTNTYLVSFGNFEHGNVSGPNSATAGDTVTLTVTPDSGYRLKGGSLKVNNGAVAISGSGPYTFTMLAENVTVTAQFEEILYYITTTGVTDGTVEAYVNGTAVTEAPAAATVTLVVTPDSGFVLEAISYTPDNGAAVTPSGSGNTYTFTMPSANVSITATFEYRAEYTVTITPTTHGTVTANKTTVKEGTSINLTMTPEAGYEIKHTENGNAVPAYFQITPSDPKMKIVGGVFATSGYFTMPKCNVTITATFTLVDYKIITNVKDGGGSITAYVGNSPTTTATINANITLRAVPSAGYELKTLTVTKVGGGAVTLNGSGNDRTFVMPTAAVNVEANFVPYNTYPITIGTITGSGTVEPNTNNAGAGDTVELTVKPNNVTANRLVAGSLKVNSGAVALTNAGNNKYTFTMPAQAVSVSAAFEPNTHNITIAGNITNGSITPSETSPIPGRVVNLTVTPGFGYQLKDGSLKATKTGTNEDFPVSYFNNKWFFETVDVDVTVTAEFEPLQTYTLTISGMSGGTVTASAGGAVVNSGGSVPVGATVTLTVTPNNGWQLKPNSLKFNTTTVGLIDGAHGFTMPGSAVTVTAEFIQAGELQAGLYQMANGVSQLVNNPPASGLANAFTWIKNSGTDGTHYLIILETSESSALSNGYGIGSWASGTTTTGNSKNLTIELRGKNPVTITQTRNAALFKIVGATSDMPHLILGNNITLAGKTDNNRPLILIGDSFDDNGETFTMKDGSKITENGNNQTGNGNAGGAVNIQGGTFNMEGGEISGNSAKLGVAVFGLSGTTFNKTGGTISGSSGANANTVIVGNNGHVIQVGTKYRDTAAGENVKTADSGFWEN
jgi:hypothetical protein